MSVTNDITFDDCNVKSLTTSEILVPWEMSSTDVVFIQHQKKTFKTLQNKTIEACILWGNQNASLVISNEKATIKNSVSFKN